MTRRVTIRDIAQAQIVETFNRYNLSPAKRGDDFLKASPTICCTRFESKMANLIW